MGRIHRFITPLLLAASIAAPSSSFAGVSVSISVAPPLLPVYVQPITPGPDYIWTPGYWAYGDDDYYWVPGTWVRAPEVGLLWTPGYWGWRDGFYVWNAGYWGPHVGYYGGINYGCGYGGSGYWGGHWDHGAFYYNTAVNHVNKTIIHNTYNKTIVNNTTIQRVSFNGGNGGTTAQPTPKEVRAAHEHHVRLTSMQTEHEHAASSNRALFASVNHGAPPIAATAKAGVFTGHGVVAAKGLNTANISSKTPEGHSPQFKSVGSNDHESFKATDTGSNKNHEFTGGPPKLNSTVPKDHQFAKHDVRTDQNKFKSAGPHGPAVQHANHEPHAKARPQSDKRKNDG